MHMECKVALLDHDYVIIPRHKLIPSVIDDICVREKDLFGGTAIFPGPMYCAIQRAKHSGYSAYHHLHYMKRIQSFDIINFFDFSVFFYKCDKNTLYTQTLTQ